MSERVKVCKLSEIQQIVSLTFGHWIKNVNPLHLQSIIMPVLNLKGKDHLVLFDKW